MDDNNRRRRRDEPPYITPDPRSSEGSGQGGDFSSSSDRFRPAPLIPSTPGARGPPTYSSFYQESFPSGLAASPQQFQPGYTQDQRQSQAFGSYSQNLMYNPSPQAAQSAAYDTTPQFEARQPAGMQMLAEGGGPFFQNEPGASTAAGLQQHASSSSSMYQHQQSPMNRPLQQGFSSSLAMGGLPQSESEAAMQQEGSQPLSPELAAENALYKATIDEVFQNIENKRLAEAGHSLLGASKWLLGHIGELGYDVDDPSEHPQRIQSWDKFNRAWLALFQRQKELLESGQLLARHSLMTQDFIIKMGDELVLMCDGIEKHGLVDYQYGVAEELISHTITECLNLQKSIQGVVPGGEGPTPGRAPP